MDRIKRIWYLSPMRAAKVQASLGIRAVSPEPSLLAHANSESRGTFRKKARSLAPLNGWACAVKICHDGMLEDTNPLDGAQIIKMFHFLLLFNNVRFISEFNTAAVQVSSFKQFKNFTCSIVTLIKSYFGQCQQVGRSVS